MMQYGVTHYPAYVQAPLGVNDLIKKSLIQINAQNTSDITQDFIDSLGEALEESKRL